MESAISCLECFKCFSVQEKMADLNRMLYVLLCSRKMADRSSRPDKLANEAMRCVLLSRVGFSTVTLSVLFLIFFIFFEDLITEPFSEVVKLLQARFCLLRRLKKRLEIDTSSISTLSGLF